MKNRKKEIENLLAELEAREQNYGIEPPDECDLVPPSLADARMDRKTRSIQWQAKKASKPPRRKGNRYLLMTIVRNLLEQVCFVLRLGGLSGSQEVADEIDDLLNSRRLMF